MRYDRRTHCKDCNVKLDFSNALYTNTSIKPRCKECQRKYERERYKTLGRDDPRNNNYGVSQAAYDKMLEIHLGGCAICKQKPTDMKLRVDHNHKTNEVRGLLCHKCNTALGLLNENEDIIWNMLEYLKRTTWSKTA